MTVSVWCGKHITNAGANVVMRSEIGIWGKRNLNLPLSSVRWP
jgi:hypothetical protein